jgi:hypothetical protein
MALRELDGDSDDHVTHDEFIRGLYVGGRVISSYEWMSDEERMVYRTGKRTRTTTVQHVTIYPLDNAIEVLLF